MKSVPSSENVKGSIKLDQILVTKSELSRYYNGFDHVDSNSNRYTSSYLDGLEAAHKVLVLMDPEKGEGMDLEFAIERAQGKLGWLAGIFCRMCLRVSEQIEVVELSPNQVYMYGHISDKSALTMYINERSAPDVSNRDMHILLGEACRRTRCTYGKYSVRTNFMEESSEPPAYAFVRTQLSLFIERLAYESLCRKERKNFVQFIKSVPGVYVLLEPKET